MIARTRSTCQSFSRGTTASKLIRLLIHNAIKLTNSHRNYNKYFFCHHFPHLMLTHLYTKRTKTHITTTSNAIHSRRCDHYCDRQFSSNRRRTISAWGGKRLFSATPMRGPHLVIWQIDLAQENPFNLSMDNTIPLSMGPLHGSPDIIRRHTMPWDFERSEIDHIKWGSESFQEHRTDIEQEHGGLCAFPDIFTDPFLSVPCREFFSLWRWPLFTGIILTSTQ